MKRTVLSLIILPVLFGTLCLNAAERTPAETVFHAMEMNGKLVGYSEGAEYPGEKAGDPTVYETTVILLLKALGQPFDVKVWMSRKVDPETGKTRYLESDITRGDQKIGSTLVFEGNAVRITSDSGGAARTLALDEDVIVDDSLRFPYLISDFAEMRDFGAGKPQEKTYKVLNVVRGEIGGKTYTLEGEETLALAGKQFDCLVFDSKDLELGIRTKLWIDTATALAVRTESSIGINSYLTDSTIKVMIVRGDMDERILARVDTAIADIMSISYMKVRAKIRTAGEWVTPESLNVKGQRFEGTVEDNFIDGVFEIEHERYDGAGAPPFPPDFGKDASLKKFLEPEDMIESDDEVLIKKAAEITKGSRDSWEAACRLSQWVAEEITYEIPGGTARFTFDTRKGECGSHSRLLTAFCRGVGIPARLVGGCMYVPMQGGSFGQHAWNEIYMGDAGWVTVDSTVKENDFVDSGHIRLGTQAAFNPVEMEILDYRAGALEMGKETAGMQALSDVPYKVGEEYTFTYSVRGNKFGTETFTVKSFDRTIADGVYTVAGGTDIQNTKTSIEYTLTHEGCPLSFTAKGMARGVGFKLECTFDGGKAVQKVVQGGGDPVENTVEVPKKFHLVANNNVSLLAFLALTAPKKEGEVSTFEAFHPASMQVFPGQITVKGRETITWAGSEVECRLLDLSLAGTPVQMWVDDEGFLLREAEQNGTVVMELAGK